MRAIENKMASCTIANITSDPFSTTSPGLKTKSVPEIGPPLARLADGAKALTPASLQEPPGDDTDAPNVRPDMRREADRLATFRNWPVRFLSPEKLANDGFYYLGRDDEVRCAFCKVQFVRWEEGDDPMEHHKRWAPQCPFLKQLATDAAPLAPLGRLAGPAYPQYATLAMRLATFKDWPRSLPQEPEDLADAGFFYTGKGDKTKCFFCGGGLRAWEREDVPWEQHAVSFARCPFLLLVKGREYVQRVVTEACAIGPSSAPAPAPAAPAPAPALATAALKSETKKAAVGPAVTAAKESGKACEGRVEEESLCRICYDNPRNVCFVPCGHVVACARCALTSDKCPMCRRTYTNAVRLYYA